MNIILFDDVKRSDLLPLCYTRPCADLRVGILTIADKWQHHTSSEVSFLTQDYLSQKHPHTYTSDNYYINGRLLPNPELIQAIKKLEINEELIDNGILLASRSADIKSLGDFSTEIYSEPNFNGSYSIVNFAYDIFSLNGNEIRSDFKLITSNRVSAIVSSTNILIGDNIFVEEGATLEAAVLNSTDGPIYIAKDATIMEGALIKGPFSLGKGSTIKMGAKIYGDTSIGPKSKIGGEVSNTVVQANSNKGHEGFLGNSVIGEWCNLGADTNSSNLKNNYASVKIWNYTKRRFLNSGLQFCGLIMGDHSKCGINTMFNTGTVVGVSANIFGAAFPRNFIPSFTWGGATGFATYSPSKAFETARIVMERRGVELDEQEKEILMQIHNDSAEHRIWEKKIINT